MRRLFFFFFPLLFLLAVLIAISTVQPTISTEEAQVVNSFNAACRVDSDAHGFGTGTLLPTGHVLTAAHVVDANGDGVLSKRERGVTVQFKDGDSYKAKVLYLGKADFAILELKDGFRKRNNVVASKRKARLGEKVYTIGSIRGHRLHISSGHISLPEMGKSRASCYISKGNSGGAIINEEGENLGIVVAVGIRRQFDFMSFPIPATRGFTTVITQIPSTVELNILCLYLSMEEMREELTDKNFEFLLDVPPSPSLQDYLTDPFNIEVALTTLEIYILLLLVIYVRKHLFS